MEAAPFHLRLLLTLLVLGNGILLVAPGRVPAATAARSSPKALATIEKPSSPSERSRGLLGPIFSLLKSSRPAVNSGNPR
jgi:hypothetical protein